MRIKTLSTQERRQLLMQSDQYKAGDQITVIRAAPILNFTCNKQTSSFLRQMCQEGLLCKSVISCRGISAKGVIVYSKPPNRLLSRAWRNKTDQEIGIESCHGWA